MNRDELVEPVIYISVVLVAGLIGLVIAVAVGWLAAAVGTALIRAVIRAFSKREATNAYTDRRCSEMGRLLAASQDVQNSLLVAISKGVLNSGVDLSNVRATAGEKRACMEAQRVDSAVKEAALKIWNFYLDNTFGPLNLGDNLKPQDIQRAVLKYETGYGLRGLWQQLEEHLKTANDGYLVVDHNDCGGAPTAHHTGTREEAERYVQQDARPGRVLVHVIREDWELMSMSGFPEPLGTPTPQ